MFLLLSDTTTSVATAYGAWGEKKVRGRTVMGMQRMTFLIDEAGTIQRIWSTVTPAGHATEVLSTCAGSVVGGAAGLPTQPC